MKLISKTAVMALALALLACDRGKPEAHTEATDSPVVATPRAPKSNHRAEEGGGVYAADCSADGGKFAIRLNKGDDGFVTADVDHDSKSYNDVLTSYSFFGDKTPTDFLLAVLFEAANAPVPVSGEAARIEIWKDGKSYYALINGDKSQKLHFCANEPG